MKYKNIIYRVYCCLLCFVGSGCEEFTEIGPPDSKVVESVVYTSDKLAIASVDGIYHQMFNSSNFASGGERSVTVLASLSADELISGPLKEILIEFGNNEVTPFNLYNLSIWSSSYNTIYMCNSVMEGLEGSDLISEELKEQLTGEVRFIRAFAYFYLVNLYGGVPLVTSTDYRENSILDRASVDDIYNFIKGDLHIATELLDEQYRNQLRITPNKYAAYALLARVSLYLKEWDMAESFASKVINRSEMYFLEPDLNEVFLPQSNEAIWQIRPTNTGYTNEGQTFILENSPLNNSLNSVYLSDVLKDSFAPEDLRLTEWIDSFVSDGDVFFYAYKYKINEFSDVPEEFSTVLRLAETYLIRAEARISVGNLTGAMSDINRVGMRAGLMERHIQNQDDLMKALRSERSKELFTEWGHRWMDLKRWNLTGHVLKPIKEFWNETDKLYPIPEQELIRNPNLNQNEGY